MVFVYCGKIFSKCNTKNNNKNEFINFNKFDHVKKLNYDKWSLPICNIDDKGLVSLIYSTLLRISEKKQFI